ncbi:hypothetical protein VAEU17_4270012 [Vibrio aestuarianus]|nr:hypothetical protein VAEU17_4270012 [Vibrio aestuarianus]CAH8230886.1 hypothetical protein VAEKB19_4560046 [Vibrio aestuarianus]
MVETLISALIIFYSKAPKKRDQFNTFFCFGKVISAHITPKLPVLTTLLSLTRYSVVAI